MNDLKEFKIVLEESGTGRTLVLPNVKACDYEIAEAYGTSIAADLPVSEVDRQKGYGPTETTWSCYPEEVVEKMRRMEWQTGRGYSLDGQIIRAVEYKYTSEALEARSGVLMYDVTRRICYQIEDCEFTKEAILLRYDCGGLRGFSPTEFKKAWVEAVDV